MRKTVFLVGIALAMLAAAACQDAPTGPLANSPALPGTGSGMGSGSTDRPALTTNEAYMGTWQATTAECWRDPAANVLCDPRDLVAEGGTVILVLEQSCPSTSAGTWAC